MAEHDKEMQGLSLPDIIKISSGFRKARVLQSAVELNLFTYLHDESHSLEEICAHMGTQPRQTMDFLDTLVALRILFRTGIDVDSVYSNTISAQKFLSKKSDEYAGAGLEFDAKWFYQNWLGLTESLKTGERHHFIQDKPADNLFDELYDKKQNALLFLRLMISVNGPSFRSFAERFDFSGHHHMVDIGGGLGPLCCEVKKLNSHMQCETLDLPSVSELASEYLEKVGMNEGVNVLSGDMFKQEFPKCDLITMGCILHDFGLEEKKILMKKAYDALPKGGELVAIEFLIDDERKENVECMLVSLQMLLATNSGFDYTANDFDGWAKEIGFESTYSIELTHPKSAVVARK